MGERRVRVVNMIPKSMSGETNQDSEPQLTVNPDNHKMILGTTFTPDPAAGPLAPIFASVDGGENWTLDLVIPGGGPFDQSIRFGDDSALYAGTLGFAGMNVLRSSPYSSTTAMAVMETRSAVDQPYVAAITSKHKDRVFIGNNDFFPKLGGVVDHSADARTAGPPAGFNQTFVDPRPKLQDGPAIRPAPHRDGTVYAAYFGWRTFGPSLLADVVVVRDDQFGTGGAPFTALTDPLDGLSGVRIAQVSIPFTGWWLRVGNQRVGASLSIAVDPSDSRKVYIAWGDGPHPGSTQTLHVRRSTDRGATWSGDLMTIQNATNPALAITTNRRVAFSYQQLVMSGPSQRWETHVQITRHAWAKPAHDILLASTPNAAFAGWDPYIGDYDDLQAVGHDLYGIFCADNYPDLANFPHGVRYQRNVDFATHTLLNVNGVTPVANSVDPFFFHIRWEEDEEDEGDEGELEVERFELKGLRYERLEIRELKFRSSECERRERHDEDEDEPEHGHERHREQRGAAGIRRLGERLEELGRRLARRRDGDDEDDNEEDDDEDE